MKTPHRIPLKIVVLSVLMVAFLSACNKEVVPDALRSHTDLYVSTEAELAYYSSPASRDSISFGVRHLIISGPFRTINGFNSLPNISQITIVDCPNLESVTGFNNLEATDFTIYRNKSLHTLNIFDSVVSLRRLSIRANSSLHTINGFNNLQNIKEFLRIGENPALQTISGFNNLRTTHQLIITENTALRSVAGFEYLQTGGIGFYNNTRLTSMPRFDSLRTGGLAVAANDNLESISGFGALVEANTHHLLHDYRFEYENNVLSNARVKTSDPTRLLSVLIVDNDRLTSISGFGRLENVDVSLELNKNAALTTVEGFQSLRLTQNQLVITRNPNLVNLPSTLRP